MEDTLKKEEEKAIKELKAAATNDAKANNAKKATPKKTPAKNGGNSKASGKKTSSKPTSKRAAAQRKSEEKNREITAEVISIAVACVSVLAIIGVYFGGGGIIGQGLSSVLKGLFGVGAYILPLVLIGFCVYMFFAEEKVLNAPKTIMIFGMLFIVLAFMHVVSINSDNLIKYESFSRFTAQMYKNGSYANGGLLGAYLGTGFYKAIGKVASIIFMIMGFICLTVFITGKSFFGGVKNAWQGFSSYFVFETSNEDDFIEEYVEIEEDYNKKKINLNIFSKFKKPKRAVEEKITSEAIKSESPKAVGKVAKNENKKVAEKAQPTKPKRDIPKPTIINIDPNATNRTRENKRINLAYDVVIAADKENITPANNFKTDMDLPEFIRNREKFEYEKFLEKGRVKPKINGLNIAQEQEEVGFVALEEGKGESYEQGSSQEIPAESAAYVEEYNYTGEANIYANIDEVIPEQSTEYEEDSNNFVLDMSQINAVEENENSLEAYEDFSAESNSYGEEEYAEINYSENESYNEEEYAEINYSESESYGENEYAEINYSESESYGENEYAEINYSENESYGENEYAEINYSENESYNEEEYAEINYSENESYNEEEYAEINYSENESYNENEYAKIDNSEALKAESISFKEIKQEPKAGLKNDTPPWEESKTEVKKLYEPKASDPVIITADETKMVNKLNIDEEAKKAEYVFPKLEFLSKNPTIFDNKNSEIELLENSKILVKTLDSFNIPANVIEISKGPAVTRYELSIADGIKVSKILNLADNLALSLAATSIRIEAPIPGKSAVGIEIPNKEVTSVYLSEVVCDEKFQNFPSKLSFGLGKDIAGNVVVTDIAKMPHMLIAGATGSGKSVCINTLITSILYKSTPDEVRLIMIDPKVVELSVYNGIPHLLVPVVTEADKAAGALNWAVQEMMERYNKFAQTGTRNLKSYNEALAEKGEKKLSQIVIIIDELADLMMVAAKEVESAICRLAQLARAAGIHLIIATQRPSVDVITGLIKANIPSRIAFAVSSGTDSRTIIDTVGAEKLLGKGDMLFKSVDMSKPLRIQGAFVTDKEVEKLVNFLKENNPVVYDDEVINKISSMKASDSGSSLSSGDGDELTDEVISFVCRSGKCSASLIQRKFRLGYNRAARIVEELEDRGIVGPENGSKPREVLMDKYQMEEYITRRAGY